MNRTATSPHTDSDSLDAERRLHRMVRQRVILWLRDVAPALLSPAQMKEAEAWSPRPSRLDTLRRLPEGTLGFEYARYFDEMQVDPPGEGTSIIPPWEAFHDVLHLVSGYPTNPRGELQVAAFTTGFSSLGWLFLLKAIVLFQWGLPIVRDVKPTVGAASYEDLRQAYDRGKGVNMDLTRWKFQDDFEVPLEELRKRFGVDP